ncbi:Deacetylases, including yeast histone deacetylase and acetoin utilization protein [Olavius algarvensis associated proteobacterium Delta 3]|nr:Deacetylases, including yeast histone deacetylase and acetoin utilization protein [Olavius algarvensis associated proteobacterium Delta 3]CAB5118189.1 Deacetylases, including yeast histone deacetylase and acetoin utilization protein [Olavius algarvensis associated proteobacterium Delta 3]
MHIYRTDSFPIPLPRGHHFPAGKYRMLARRLVDDGIVSSNEMRLPREATREELLRVHAIEYLTRLERGEMTAKEMRRIGLPWSVELVDRARRSVGATVESCVAAMNDGFAVSLSGGTHHAFPDRGEGFCLFNDVAVAARAIQAAGRAERILVIDADVHQGNGTAFIFRSDPTVFTFSIHGKNNFPFHKQAGDLDVNLADGTGDETYLKALRSGLETIAGGFTAEMAIYLAGADPYHDDRYGRVALSKEGLALRDREVLAFCRKHQLPVVVTMAGGYARNIADTVDIHVQTVRIFQSAAREFEK